MKKLLFTIVTLFVSYLMNAQDSWVNVVNGGFGNTYNNVINKLYVFKGHLYASTSGDSVKLYRSVNGNLGAWQQVYAANNAIQIADITSTNEGTGYIYLTVEWSDSSKVLRSSDGLDWSTVSYSATHPYGQGISLITPFKGIGGVDSLYITIGDGNYGDVVKKGAYDYIDTVNTWQEVCSLTSLFSGGNFTTTTVHNGKLYAGTDYYGRLVSTNDGTNWEQNTFVGDGFGNYNNYMITSLVSFGGAIYAGTYNTYDGPEIWKSTNDTLWTLVKDFHYDYKAVEDLIVADGKLWAAVASQYGYQVLYKMINDTTFVSSDSNGFNADGIKGDYATMAQFGNNIYWGGRYQMTICNDLGITSDTQMMGAGAQIWRLCTAVTNPFSAGLDTLLCEGLSATFTPTAGFDSYIWDDTINTQVLITNVKGPHYLTAIDTTVGCSVMDTVILNTKKSPSVNVFWPESTPTICKGDTVNINANTNSNIYINQPTTPFTKTGLNKFIDYAAVAYDTLVVSGITDTINASKSLISITIDSLDHQYSGDVRLILHAPNGSYIYLTSYNGISNLGYKSTQFRVDGIEDVSNANAPYTGVFRSQDPFNYLSGNPNGNWVLEVSDNYYYDSGTLKGWSLQFGYEDTIMTYAWTPSAGLSSTSKLNIDAIPQSTTTYTLSATNAIGCTTQDSLKIIVPELKITASKDSLCYGLSAVLNVVGGINNYWSPATGLDTTAGITVNATPLANTIYYVRDTVSGCSLVDSLLIAVDPLLTANSDTVSAICAGDSVALKGSATGGTTPYTFLWNAGAGSDYAGATPFVSPITGTTYSLTVTDAFGCTSQNSVYVSVISSKDIVGHVSYSGGKVTQGIAVAYRYVAGYQYFDTVRTSLLDTAGNYHFSAIKSDNYIIKVFVDTAAYPNLFPTYYGDVFLWDSATVVAHGCDMNDTLNIVMVEKAPLAGTGLLTGKIVEDVGFNRAPGEPIPGIDVKLGKNPGGSFVVSTVTDSTGRYTFANVPFNLTGEFYTIYVDIPGIGRDSSYNVTVSADKDAFYYLDYKVDSNTVNIVPNAGAGIVGAANNSENKFTVYPNPSNGNASVEFSVMNDAIVSVEVVNVLGERIKTLTAGKHSIGNYKYQLDKLQTGIYFITLTIDQKSTTQRIVVME